MPWNRGDVVNESRSIPASALGGRFSSSIELLIVVGDIVELWNNSSNQVLRRILEGMCLVKLGSRKEVMGIIGSKNGAEHVQGSLVDGYL